jgi:hypothetical protein
LVVMVVLEEKKSGDIVMKVKEVVVRKLW